MVNVAPIRTNLESSPPVVTHTRAPVRALRLALRAALCGAWLGLAPAMAGAAQFSEPTVTFEVSSYTVEGPNPLGPERTQEILAPFTGKHAGVEGLNEAALSLERELRALGYSFYRVVLPQQTLSGGTVRLAVVEFLVSGVQVRGNEYFDEDNIQASLPALVVGESPKLGDIGRNLALANSHPSKQVDITLSESETQERALVAGVDVKDSKPWSVFASLDNTGSSSTGPWRWTAGGAYNNLFNLDHSIVASYTSSPGHAYQVKQLAGSYRAPIYALGGELSAYAVRSDVEVGRVLNAFDVSGRGNFYGARYTHILARRAGITSRAWVGVDDKLFDSTIQLGVSNLAQDVRSRPLTVGIGAAYEGDSWNGDAAIEYVRNLQIGGGNNNAAYGANRAGAKAHWDVIRANASASTPLFGNWVLRGSVSGQLANEELIAGEQFGVGGVRSVRGFQEREYAGDDGTRGSVELWAPPVEVVDGANPVQLLGFFDTARVWLKSGVLPDGHDSMGTTSAGLGVRWSWRRYVSTSFDVGRILDGGPGDSGFRGHMSLLMIY
jgi:hemolysin activation/secretion protein